VATLYDLESTGTKKAKKIKNIFPIYRTQDPVKLPFAGFSIIKEK